MTFFSRKPLRILGIPVGTEGLRSRAARMRRFEPENPRLFVPRAVGIGWDLNVGALAVRLGLIRPDDSLPDLEDHVPSRTAGALAVAPWAGLALLAATGAGLRRRHATLPGGWTASLRPKPARPTDEVLARTLLPCPALATWNAVDPWPQDGVDVVGNALTLGVESSMALTLLAAARAARRPDRRSFLGGLAPLAIPTVMTAVIVATVRRALRNLDAGLRAGDITPHTDERTTDA